MDKLNITSDSAASCLSVLKAAGAPLRAIEIARRLQLSGSRETQRRKVRAIIKLLRDKGCKIVATRKDGYCLTEDDKACCDYLEDRQIDAKRVLGKTHNQKKMLTSPDGQGSLFGQRMMRVVDERMRYN